MLVVTIKGPIARLAVKAEKRENFSTYQAKQSSERSD